MSSKTWLGMTEGNKANWGRGAHSAKYCGRGCARWTSSHSVVALRFQRPSSTMPFNNSTCLLSAHSIFIRCPIHSSRMLSHVI